MNCLEPKAKLNVVDNYELKNMTVTSLVRMKLNTDLSAEGLKSQQSQVTMYCHL